MSDVNINEMLQIKRDKLKRLKNDGKNPHIIEKVIVTAKSKEIIKNFENFEGKEVTVAGRILGKRTFGKISFWVLQDDLGKIQIFNRENVLGSEIYEDTKI